MFLYYKDPEDGKNRYFSYPEEELIAAGADINFDFSRNYRYFFEPNYPRYRYLILPEETLSVPAEFMLVYR